MTVSYTGKVVTSKGFPVFIKLLLRWRGSIYKLIWKDLLVFLLAFYAINLPYRFILEGESKLLFEKVVRYCHTYLSLIPLSFVLGFYVTIVMNRWWQQFTQIPYPDNLALLLSASIRAQDEKGRLMRRTITRYICLAFTITMTIISPRAKKRFPTTDHFIEAGLLMKDERKIFEDLDEEYPGYTKYWLPLAWAGNLITRARKEGSITSDTSVRSIMQELNAFRTKCGALLDYDWISVPLVYTQVVTVAVYAYFCTTTIAHQMIDPRTDVYFPFLSVLEFFFYMGWLKVAEALINPFGEDDDDFEVNWLIDRHVLITYLLVDKMHQEHPKLIKDEYWQKMAQNKLPYTVATEHYKEECPVHSTDYIVLKKNQSEIVMDRRDTKDGKMKRQGSIFRRWRRDSTRSTRPANTGEEVIQIDSEFPEITITPPTTASDHSEFNRLIAARKSLTKRRIKRVLSLLRKKTIEESEENELINQLVNTH